MRHSFSDYDDSLVAIGAATDERANYRKSKRVRQRSDPSFFEVPVTSFKLPFKQPDRLPLPISCAPLPDGCQVFSARWIEAERTNSRARRAPHGRTLAREVVSEALSIRRKAAYERLGLSNVPYLPVSPVAPVSDDVLNSLHELFGVDLRPAKPYKVLAELRPASVKLRVESVEAANVRMYHPPQASESKGVTRGVIKELSKKSRMRLQAKSYELEAMGYKPEQIWTLTYPGEWSSVAPDGGAVKRHLDVFRKRLERYLSARDVSLSCLWFLEFQERGAPHFHMLVWGGLNRLNRKNLRSWVSRNWAKVVNHAELSEQEKHERVGTSVQKMRKKHFGYAAKYASKMTQKVVPSEFSNVGRFWGVWNVEKPVCPVVSFQLSLSQYHDFAKAVILNYHDFDTFKFYQRLCMLLGLIFMRNVETTYNLEEMANSPPKPGFTVTLFGEGAKDIIQSFC